MKSIKLYIYAAVSAAFAILVAILKIKSAKLDTAEQIMDLQRADIKIKNADKEVSEDIRASLAVDKKRISEEYDVKMRKVLESMDDKPLSDELIQLLNNRSKE